MNGLQCLKSLYLTCHQPELKDPVSPFDQYIMSTGTQVGILARRQFPQGTLIKGDHDDEDQAFLTTQDALANNKIEHIFEASFCFENITIRIDILKKNKDNSVEIIEVKSSTKVKPEYISDIALQLHVLKCLGYTANSCKLMHINSSYVYQGGDYDLNELFITEDVINDVEEELKAVPTQLKQFRSILDQDKVPTVEVGSHCKNPNKCRFFNYCRKDFPKDHITKLYMVNDKKLGELRSKKIDTIADIPSSFKLSDTQLRIRQALIDNKSFISDEVQKTLSDLIFPIYFMDFETSNPALPLFPKSNPWKQIPFQWSVHILDEKGNLTHKEFLPNHNNDPRPDFARELVNSVGQHGSIVVYFERFEKGIIGELAEHFGGKTESQLNDINNRVFDLYQLVLKHIYHPNFNNSFSIKTVLPALVQKLSYKDMNIADGTAALIAYQKLLKPEISKAEKEKIRKDLLAYCKLDTLAMVEIYKVLLAAKT